MPYLVLPAMPCTISIQTRRVLGFAAAVRRAGVMAGNIDSRKGKATVAPMPCSIFRREMCFFVRNIKSSLASGHRPLILIGGFCCRRFRRAHLERGALDDAHNKC